MKTTLLRLLSLAACTATFVCTTLPVRSQDQPVQEEESEEAPQKLTPDEAKKRYKELEKAQNAEIRKMLKVFTALEGEWTGKEKIEHTEEEDKAFDIAWNDVWKGFFTMEGRYFEMTGQTDGENASTYRWVCTWLPAEESYQAWYFGETTQTLYTGELSSDGKYVIWTRTDEVTEAETKFSMIPEGDRVKCAGTDRKDGRVSSRQSSSYTRKKVEL